MLKDQKAQATAIDEMLASGSAGLNETPGKFQYFSGLFAYQANDFAKASQQLKLASDAGYKADDLGIMLADASFRTGQPALGAAAADKAFAEKKASGQPVPEAWYRVVVSQSYKAKDYSATNRFMRQLITAYPTPTNWRDALVLYRDSAKLDPAQATDDYRLMRSAKALDGERDYTNTRCSPISVVCPAKPSRSSTRATRWARHRRPARRWRISTPRRAPKSRPTVPRSPSRKPRRMPAPMAASRSTPAMPI